MHLESRRFPYEEQPPGLEIPSEPLPKCTCECPNCKAMRERLEKIYYCLAVAQQLADIRP
jgi:hypothetical protein